MLHINTDPVAFEWKHIEQFKQRNIRTEYVLETEYNGLRYAVFYGGCPCVYRYAYWTQDQYKWRDIPAVDLGDTWIEDLEFVAVQANNGDVIYSRYNNEHRVSDDGSVWVCGDRVSDTSKQCKLTVFKGRVEYWQ